MRVGVMAMVAAVVIGGTASGQPVSKQITAADTALLFGGADAEGGVGDWYLSNGVVQAIIDDVGIDADLVGILPPDQVPPLQSQAAATGGTLIDLGRVGQDGDELVQLFTVGGLSTDRFFFNESISAPSPGVVRVVGKLPLPPLSVAPNLCLDAVTDFAVAGSDPFLTITTMVTNNCSGTHPEVGSFLDALLWTQHGIVPFSAGGKGFDHPALDFNNLAGAVEIVPFVGAPGMLRAEDGVMDPANGTLSNAIAYGLLPIRVERDDDGPGPTPPVVTPLTTLFGVSSTLVTAMGALPLGMVPPGGTVMYVRRVYVGASRDVRAVSDLILPELATRDGFATGTVSGDVDASDTPDVEASIVFVRLGTCTGNANALCKANSDCPSSGPCTDPQPALNFPPGGAVTHVRTDPAGKFSGVILPRGHYEVDVVAAEREDIVQSGVTVDTGDNPVVLPALSPRGLVRFTVREKAKGRPAIPAKLVFKGAAAGTVDPTFHRDLRATLGGDDVQAETFGGTQRGPDGDARGQGNVVYTATGIGSIHVKAGTYDVYATRGPEYGIAKKRVVVTSGRTAAVKLNLKRVVRTPDALAADFHVHSGRSLDSAAPLEDRVVSYAGEGVEVMISTDHDKQLDYAPVIAKLGLGARIASIPGVEITGMVPNPPSFPNSIGHLNSWPLPLSKDLRRDGAIHDEYIAPNWIYTRLRREGGDDVVIQYNHPRAGVSGLTSIGIFNSIGCSRCSNAIDTACTMNADCGAAPAECTCVGYQPDRPLTMPPNDILLDTGVRGPGTAANPMGVRNIDFDIIEIANGAKTTDYPAYLQMRDDWFSLLSQGVIKPGTGVSDSHRITVEHAGWARTYVRGVGDDPAALDVGAFDTSIKAGRLVVSAGPYIQVSARGSGTGGPGDVVASATGAIRLTIDVRSPAWIPVDEVRVVTIRRFGPGGVETRTFDAKTKPRVRPVPKNFQSNGGTSRFHGTIGITYASDYLVIVEAGPKLGATPVSPPIVNVVEPDVVPLGFADPIFVDVGGDGFALDQGTPVRTAPPPGRMTGVTRAAREDAIRRGDYFPLHGFRLDPAAVAAARGAR